MRKFNDQDASKLFSLIDESREQSRRLTKKFYLWRRFWKSIELYLSGGTYQDVLKIFFGVKSSAKVISKKKIKDFNTLLTLNQ